VLGKKEDGYHELKSVMQTIGLLDILGFEESDKIELECSVPLLQMAENLVLKAANILRQESGCKGGARIRLKKRIPWASGLGGGSSDAAITLLGLNKLWSLGLSYEQLAMIAAEVGSDVPFFVYGGRCLVQGRGDRVTPLPDIKTTYFVLLKPELPEQINKTRRLYSILRSSHYTTGDLTERAISAMDGGKILHESMIFNVFDSVAFEAFPGLGKYWNDFLHVGVGNVHLAGSGPVLFALAENKMEAAVIRQKLMDCCIKCCVVASTERAELEKQRS
jgi:4-diphosphocytidyl-2-C-methyl-D-erythritol kinase